jgi:hypothetical protein
MLRKFFHFTLIREVYGDTGRITALISLGDILWSLNLETGSKSVRDVMQLPCCSRTKTIARTPLCALLLNNFSVK